MPYIRKNELKIHGTSYRIHVKAKDPRQNKWLIKTMTWRKPADMTDEDAEFYVKKVAIEFQEKFEKQLKGILAIDNNITFIEYANMWGERIKQTRSLAYYNKILNEMPRLESYFMSVRLKDITPRMVQGYIDEMISHGVVTERAEVINDIRQYMADNGYVFTRVLKKVGLAHSVTTLRVGSTILVPPAKRLSEYIGVKFEDYFKINTKRRDYAKETLVKSKRLIATILATAKRQRIIDENFATREYIEPIRGEKREVPILDDVQAKKLIDYMETSTQESIKEKIPVYIALLMGFRRGEVAGLEWKDIDFEKKTIKVSRSLTTVTRFGKILKEPKTELSKRVVSMPDIMVNKLLEYREWWNQMDRELGCVWSKSDRLFSLIDGQPGNPHGFINSLHKMLERAELPKVCFHSLRHTNITLQLIAGVDIKTVASRAGHARASTTSDFYSHYVKSIDYRASEVIDKLFNDKKEEYHNMSKVKAYYGAHGKYEQENLIGEFESMQDAENYVYRHIKDNHKDSGYIRKIFQSDKMWWYDYGHHAKFYTIISD